MKMHWLRHLREQSQISQEELVARLQAEGFEVTRAALSHWETGRTQPPLDNPKLRQGLAHIFHISVFDLLTEAGYELLQPDQSQNAKRAAYIIDQLPPERQKLAISVLEQFLRARTG